MLLISRKCRLAFFVAFKFQDLKGDFHGVFEFYPIFAEFSLKIIDFPQNFALRGIILQKLKSDCRFYCSSKKEH